MYRGIMTTPSDLELAMQLLEVNHFREFGLHG